jgi:hypothetical protein
MSVSVKPLFDFSGQKTRFLASFKNSQTRRLYADSLGKFVAWAAKNGINPAFLDYGTAEIYISFLKSDGRAPASVRRDITAVSSIYNFIGRQFPAFRNPFRGSRAIPRPEARRKPAAPTESELAYIIRHIPDLEKAAVIAMTQGGLELNSLPGLRVLGSSYETTCRGRKIRGSLPPALASLFDQNRISGEYPFGGLSQNALEKRLCYHIAQLAERGKIRFRYAGNDFRRYFAIKEYSRHGDVVRLSAALNHTSILATANFVKRLDSAIAKPHTLEGASHEKER